MNYCLDISEAIIQTSDVDAQGLVADRRLVNQAK